MTNLEKAKRDYPVGTKFRDEYGNERTVSSDSHYIGSSTIFYDDKSICCGLTPKEEWDLPGGQSNPYIYNGGKWAPIISKPVEWKIQPDRVDYYNSYSVEVIDMMERVFGKEKLKIFCELNAFKYRMRAGLKTEGDLEKEKYYLDKMRELS